MESFNLSTGEPSTLKTYRKWAAALFPKALPMLDARIEQFGEDEIVVQHESQMLYLFAQIEFHGAPEHPAVTFTENEGLASVVTDLSPKKDRHGDGL